jgi:DNA-binding NarL/FixJ family response regulator
LRIFVADDNEIVRRGVVGILSSEPKWEVCGEAPNGVEALQRTQELLPDLVLLDISMPGIGGLDVARHLRLTLPKTKIIVMSQHDPAYLRARVIEAGADACLDKGLLASQLLATIKNLMEP